MKTPVFLLMICFLCSCAGTVPVPLPANSAAEETGPPQESVYAISQYLNQLENRVKLLESRGLAANDIDGTMPKVWACSIELPFGGGRFFETSTDKLKAMYRVSEQCTKAGNSSMKCEFNLNCFYP